MFPVNLAIDRILLQGPVPAEVCDLMSTVVLEDVIADSTLECSCCRAPSMIDSARTMMAPISTPFHKASPTTAPLVMPTRDTSDCVGGGDKHVVENNGHYYHGWTLDNDTAHSCSHEDIVRY